MEIYKTIFGSDYFSDIAAGDRIIELIKALLPTDPRARAAELQEIMAALMNAYAAENIVRDLLSLGAHLTAPMLRDHIASHLDFTTDFSAEVLDAFRREGVRVPYGRYKGEVRSILARHGLVEPQKRPRSPARSPRRSARLSTARRRLY